jgi:hypothetical protein
MLSKMRGMGKSRGQQALNYGERRIANPLTVFVHSESLKFKKRGKDLIGVKNVAPAVVAVRADDIHGVPPGD